MPYIVETDGLVLLQYLYHNTLKNQNYEFESSWIYSQNRKRYLSGDREIISGLLPDAAVTMPGSEFGGRFDPKKLGHF